MVEDRWLYVAQSANHVVYADIQTISFKPPFMWAKIELSEAAQREEGYAYEIQKNGYDCARGTFTLLTKTEYSQQGAPVNAFTAT